MPATLISEEQLIELVEAIWSTMLGLRVTAPDDEPVVHNSAGPTCSVVISGSFSGTVQWLPTERFARRATALMLGVSESSVKLADVDDAMAELCNIVGGAAKGLLPGPSSLSMPRVTRGSQWDAHLSPPKVAAQLRFTCEDEPLQVRILSECVLGPPLT